MLRLQWLVGRTLRGTLCWSGHPQNAPTTLARNLLLNGEALCHWWYQFAAHPGDVAFCALASCYNNMLQRCTEVVLRCSFCCQQDSAEKDRRIRELSVSHGNEMHKLDSELCSTRMQLEAVRTEWVRALKGLKQMHDCNLMWGAQMMMTMTLWNIMCTNLFFNRLTDAQRELNETKSKSVNTLHSAEDEILQLREEWVTHLHAATKLFYLFSCWR